MEEVKVNNSGAATSTRKDTPEAEKSKPDKKPKSKKASKKKKKPKKPPKPVTAKSTTAQEAKAIEEYNRANAERYYTDPEV